jgi:hypothetical protein
MSDPDNGQVDESADLHRAQVDETVNLHRHAIAGALFDFLGFLTTSDEVWTFSAQHDAAPAVRALEQWAGKRGLSLAEADVSGWNATNRDAERYRWLRQQDWFAGKLCVLRDPKKILTSGSGLGADCPARDRLDAAIDAAMSGAPE